MRLFLIPTPISDSPYKPPLEIFDEFKTLYVENLRSARRFISSLGLKVGEFEFIEIPEKVSDNFLNKVIFPSGILSEAGCPGVADPGSEIVRYAHKKNVEVVPLVGPSSIILALMASGLNGQDFHFHGYLPIKDITSALKRLEKESGTHIFIETPYRNQKTFEACLKALSPNTLLLVAYDIMGSQQFIKTKIVSAWRKDNLMLPKLPCVFGFLKSNR